MSSFSEQALIRNLWYSMQKLLSVLVFLGALLELSPSLFRMHNPMSDKLMIEVAAQQQAHHCTEFRKGYRYIFWVLGLLLV